MARDSQVHQIGFISFAILSVLLAIVSFLTWRGWQEQAARAEQAEASANAARAERNAAVDQVLDLKTMVSEGAATLGDIQAIRWRGNYANDAEMQDLIEKFQQHMAMFGDGHEGNRNYQRLPEHLLTTIQDMNQQIARLSDEVNQAVAQRDAARQQAEERIAAALEAASRDAEDLRTARAAFDTQLQALRNEQVQLRELLAERDARITALDQQLAQARQQFDREAGSLQQIVEQQREKIEGLEQSEFEVPDGRVVRVDQVTRTVWIDLGSADGLRREMTFSVYGQNDEGVMTRQRKGSIEVTQVTGPQLAQARILEDSNRNIIVPGDRIHTPAWQPGSGLSFALVGEMTIDGQSNRELLHDLIRTHNGTVDAEVLPSGEFIGEISPQTRFLIFGSTPEDAVGNQRFQESWNRVITQAQRFGVARISLDQFLAYMGWQGQVRTVNLGAGARPEDFTRPGAVRESTGTTSELFRNRRPPQRGLRGAY